MAKKIRRSVRIRRNVAALSLPSRRFARETPRRRSGASARLRPRHSTRPGRKAVSGIGRKAGGFLNVLEPAVFLALFFDKAPSDEVLELLVSPQTKHFLSPTDGVSGFQVFVDDLEQVVEPEGFLIRKDSYQFVCDVIRNPA